MVDPGVEFSFFLGIHVGIDKRIDIMKYCLAPDSTLHSAL